MYLEIANWFASPPAGGDPYLATLITTQADSRTAYGVLSFDWHRPSTRITGVGQLYFSDRGNATGDLFSAAADAIDTVEFEITQTGQAEYALNILNRRWGNRTLVVLRTSNPNRLLLGWGSPIGQGVAEQALYVFSIKGRQLN